MTLSPILSFPGVNLANGETAEIVAVTRIGDEHPQAALFDLGAGNVLDDAVKEEAQIFPVVPVLGVFHGNSFSRVGINDREVDMVVLGVQIEKQAVDLIHDLFDTRIGAVDLIDDHDDLEIELQSVPQDETGLRQWAFGRVYQKQSTRPPSVVRAPPRPRNRHVPGYPRY